MGLSSKLSCEAGSFSHCCKPHRFFQLEILRLYFPALEPWVARSALLPSCSSCIIHVSMGLPTLPATASPSPGLQPPPCREPSPPGCLSPPLLPVWMSVSSLTPWLSDFHTVRFSGSSGYILFLNLLLSVFWFCKEAQCVYLRLPLGQKLLHSNLNISGAANNNVNES